MADRPRVSIVILAHNKARFTRLCLEAILQTEYPDVELCLVNNGSEDETPSLLDRAEAAVAERPGWSVLRLDFPENIGAVQGRNAALEKATGEHIVFMDNDVVVAARDWLGRMVDRLAADGSIGALGPKLVFPRPENVIQCAGCEVTPTGRVNFRGRGQSASSLEYNIERDVQCLISALWIMRRAVVEKIGHLDMEFHPVQFEDIDYCYRMREAGWRVVYFPEVTAYHYENVTSGGTGSLNYRYLTIKNGLVFKKRWRHMYRQENGPSDESVEWVEIPHVAWEALDPPPGLASGTMLPLPDEESAAPPAAAPPAPAEPPAPGAEGGPDRAAAPQASLTGAVRSALETAAETAAEEPAEERPSLSGEAAGASAGEAPSAPAGGPDELEDLDEVDELDELEEIGEEVAGPASDIEELEELGPETPAPGPSQPAPAQPEPAPQEGAHEEADEEAEPRAAPEPALPSSADALPSGAVAPVEAPQAAAPAPVEEPGEDEIGPDAEPAPAPAAPAAPTTLEESPEKPAGPATPGAADSAAAAGSGEAVDADAEAAPPADAPTGDDEASPPAPGEDEPPAREQPREEPTKTLAAPAAGQASEQEPAPKTAPTAAETPAPPGSGRHGPPPEPPRPPSGVPAVASRLVLIAVLVAAALMLIYRGDDPPVAPPAKEGSATDESPDGEDLPAAEPDGAAPERPPVIEAPETVSPGGPSPVGTESPEEPAPSGAPDAGDADGPPPAEAGPAQPAGGPDEPEDAVAEPGHERPDLADDAPTAAGPPERREPMEPSGTPWSERTFTGPLPACNIVLYADSGILLLRAGAAHARIWRGVSIRLPVTPGGAEWSPPTGQYRVIRRQRTAAGARRLVLDYPALRDAEALLESGRLGEADVAAIRRAHEAGEVPPSDTALGGPLVFYAEPPPRGPAPAGVRLEPAQMEELWIAVPRGARVLILEQ